MRSVKWMLVTTVAPEYILGKALADLFAAGQSKNQMREYAKLDGVDWGLTHAFFANMGGFTLGQNAKAMPNYELQNLRLDTQAPLAGQRELEVEGANRAEQIALRVLDSPRLNEDARHESVSAREREEGGTEDRLLGLPRIPSGRISIRPVFDGPPPSPETEIIRIHHHTDRQQELNTSQSIPRRILKASLASYPANQTSHLLTPTGDTSLVESSDRIVNSPEINHNKSSLPERILRRRATRSKVVTSRREEREPVLDLGASIWELPSLRDSGGILSLLLDLTLPKILTFAT